MGLTIFEQIRSLKFLKNQEWLWNLLRKPYRNLLNIRGNGVKMNISKVIDIIVPPEYYHEVHKNFEPDTVKKIVDFIKKEQNIIVIDIGCSIGLLSAVSLFSSNNAEVIALDSDIQSVKSAERIIKYSPNKNLKTIYGFVSDQNKSGFNFDSAINNTRNEIERKSIKGDPIDAKFVCLQHDKENKIPTSNLDELFYSKFFPTKKTVLIKCDVEGAELFVLKGAKKILSEYNPVLLLSVHPQFLPLYKHTKQDVEAILNEYGYKIDVFSIDHEEHWWCTKELKSI